MRADYYKDGHHHVCIFCETPLARLENGKLIPNSSKTHVVFKRKDPAGLFTINCCKDCSRTKNFNDAALCAEIEAIVLNNTPSAIGSIDNSFYIIENDVSPKERLMTLEKFALRGN